MESQPTPRVPFGRSPGFVRLAVVLVAALGLLGIVLTLRQPASPEPTATGVAAMDDDASTATTPAPSETDPAAPEHESSEEDSTAPDLSEPDVSESDLSESDLSESDMEPTLVEEVLAELMSGAEADEVHTMLRAADDREIDRLIEVFAQRAAERNESIEYRRLGELHLERAELDADLADYRGALDAYTAAVVLDPSIPNLIGQGRAALGVHDFYTAAAAAEEIQAIDPDDVDGILLAADVGFALEDPDVVVEPLAALVDAVGDDPAILVRQAELATLAGEPGAAQRATAFAQQAVARAQERELEPEALAYYQTYAGRVAFDRGELEAASQLLEAALTNAPDDHGTLGELARVRGAQGEVREAIVLLERANALVPEPDHVVLVGDFRARIGDLDGAIADYENAIRLATANADLARAWGHSVVAELLDDGPADAADDELWAEQLLWAEEMVERAADLEPPLGRELDQQLADRLTDVSQSVDDTDEG